MIYEAFTVECNDCDTEEVIRTGDIRNVPPILDHIGWWWTPETNELHLCPACVKKQRENDDQT